MADGFFRCDSCQARLFGYQPINMANGSAFHVLPVDVEGYTVVEAARGLHKNRSYCQRELGKAREFISEYVVAA